MTHQFVPMEDFTPLIALLTAGLDDDIKILVIIASIFIAISTVILIIIVIYITRWVLKIADFGLGDLLDEAPVSHLLYQAPELLRWVVMIICTLRCSLLEVDECMVNRFTIHSTPPLIAPRCYIRPSQTCYFDDCVDFFVATSYV